MNTNLKNRLVRLGDLQFTPYISAAKIQARVKELGQQIAKDYQHTCPLIICILNGSFIFCSDLVRAISVDSEVQFLKVSSYRGTSSTGDMKMSFDTLPALEGREVIIVEDIVDKGHTIHFLHQLFSEKPIGSLRLASLLLKPKAYEYEIPIDYIGFEIPNDFVVGYGLDYDQKGRNLPDIYTLHKD
jgi:hypoxanthine phosphoribosyltransferase